MAYWDDEKPVVFSTGSNTFMFYRDARMLQVARPNWVDKDGNEHHGKTVAVHLDSATVAWLKRILEEVE